LFNLVADVFSKILFKAATNHLICGLLPQAIPGGVISLQYADDTIIFLQKDLGMARNLKWLLTCFECMSGMPINYHKSDLLTINVDGDEANLFAQVFGCKLGNFPFTYLGVPLHFSKLRREDLRPVLDKIFNKGIAGWRGKLLSYRGRLILLQACIASIPMYLLSFIKFPKWVITAINSQMAHFFWNNTEDSHKYHLVNWGFVSRKKEFGGLGIQNLREFNLCLLASWIKRYHLDNNKIWRMIVDYKYNLSPNMIRAQPAHCSPFWKDVMWAASAAKVGFKWCVCSGKNVLFWEDIWFGDCSLSILFWDLYIIVNEQMCVIADVWDGVNLKFTFRRTVSPALFARWLELVALVRTIQLTDCLDQPVWLFHPSGVYSVKSFYGVINNGGVIPVHTPAVWKLHVPPRTHIFLWLLANNKLLTRDNLDKRRVVDDKTCLFCCELETAHHLFFECVVARVLWCHLSEILKIDIGADFESVARWWISENKNSVINIFSSAVLWILWSTRNELCFQGKSWPGVKNILRRLCSIIRTWRPLCLDKHSSLLDSNLLLLDHIRGELLRIAWT
jgi:hypothetical protein